MFSSLLVKNTLGSILFQITTIICGFVVPRLILKSYGSDINGLVNSIAQFLAVISLLEFGVGSVVQSALYKPLAIKSKVDISSIISSANNFFRRLAQILVVYVFVLIAIYPNLVNDSFSWMYTALLILAISISSFAQYYFGVVDRLLLTSDQRGYIQYNAQTITLIINTIACYVLIDFGYSIHIVKLTTSIIYLIRPIYLRWYVNKYYDIDRDINYIGEPIKQKWNGVAQHLAAVALDGTALIILTTFDNLKSVSIYSTYFLVVSGIKQLFIASTNGIQAIMGNLWAKQELEELKKFFIWTEWSLHNLIVFLFGCTLTLIVPFVMIYTSGVSDAQYYQPLFAMFLVIAHSLHCFRLPYNIMILACGHYKQTQNCYIIAMILNLVISIGLVYCFGLVGIACGAFLSLLYQVLWMAFYNCEALKIVKWKNFTKQIIVDILMYFIGIYSCNLLNINCKNYTDWAITAITVAFVWGTIILVVNFIAYKDRVIMLKRKICDKLYSIYCE